MLKLNVLYQRLKELKNANLDDKYYGMNSIIHGLWNGDKRYYMGMEGGDTAFVYEISIQAYPIFANACYMLTRSDFNLMDFEIKNVLGEEFIKKHVKVLVEHGKFIELPKSQTRLEEFQAFCSMPDYPCNFPGIGRIIYIGRLKKN